MRLGSHGRLWIATELYYPDEAATAHCLTRIAEGLASRSRGPVHVICGIPSYWPSCRSVRRTELREGVHITRVPSTRLNRHFLLFRLINAITLCLSLLVALLVLLRRRDRILVVTNPPLLPMAVLAAGILRGTPCTLLMHDVYPDVLVATGVIGASGILHRFLERISTETLKRMETIIVPGTDMQRLITQRSPAKEGRIHVIPHWADLGQIIPQPKERSRLLARLGLAGRFVIQYSGTLGRTHPIERVLQAATALSDLKDVHFLVIGDGYKREELTRWLKLNRLPNVTYIPPLPRKELPDSLVACDIALVMHIPGMLGVSVPSRTYNILAAGRPVIAIVDLESDLGVLVRRERLGWVIPPRESYCLPQTIQEAHRNPSLLQEMGQRGRRLAERDCRFSAAIDRYASVLATAPVCAEAASLRRRGGDHLRDDYPDPHY